MKFGGALPHIPDSRDYPAELYLGAVGRPYIHYYSLVGSNELSQNEDQLDYNSCVAHGVSTCIETFAKVKGWPHYFELSRMHLYNEGRKVSGTFPENDGMYIRDAWKAVQKQGITIEEVFPYTKDNFNTPIGLQASIFSRWYPKFNYYWILTDIATEKHESIKVVISEKRVPIAFGIGLSSSFYNATSKVVYKPKKREAIRFYHCMVIVGFDEDRNAYQIRNSWGLWGDDGCIWVDKDWLLANATDLSYAWD